LLILVIGLRWWPLIPIAALMSAAIGHQLTSLHYCLALVLVQLILAGLLTAGAWYSTERLQMRLPLRHVRDVATFFLVFSVGVPLIAGCLAMCIQVWLNQFEFASVPSQLVRFILGDSTTITVIVPSVVALIGWKSLRPPGDQEQSPWVLGGLLAGCVALVLSGCYVAVASHGPLLDVSFIAVAWLAIRYGMRGAVLGILVSDTSVTIAFIFLHFAPAAFAQYEGFLIASALMALVIGGLMSEHWDLLEKISRRAYVDDLTGLPNRDRLVEWIEERGESSLVLVMLDIDDMRLLNEGVGRAVADGLLQELAIRLRTGLPTSYYVARVSADEFAVATVDERSPLAIISELRTFFEAPFLMDGNRMFVSISIGAVRMARTKSADEILRKADLALHRSKSSPSRTVVYTPDLQRTAAPSLVGELHRAVERDEFVLFYQPIFQYDRERLVWRVAGAEALLRWNHPDRGIVSPVDFIELLERLAICERVGKNVVDWALAQAAEWREYVPDFKVWVNLFSRQALARDYYRQIEAAVQRSGLPPDALVVEISEGIVASDEREVAAFVRALKSVGVLTAIDDFGTGGSSLGRVTDVPAEVLKIDRSFVTRSEVDAKAKAVALTIVRLANELGMTVLAEGVENAMQVDAMLDVGCYLAQGYALGHPLPAELFLRTILEVSEAV
jgi:diguanylate cyclase (GGDEF)-like protein